MARKSILELIAQATADFADNVTGNITPAKLRTWAIDFLNSISPGYSVLSAAGPLTQTFGLTPALVVFNTVQNSLPSEIVAAVPASTIVRSEKGTTTINFTADIETNNGRFVTFTLYKNGVATPWRITGNGGGAGNPIAVALTAIDYADPPATYSIQATAETAGTSVTLSQMALVAAIEPVRSFT
jgi:hypothetical protein